MSKPKVNVKDYRELRNATKEMYHGLMQLSNSPHYVHLGTLIRLIKENIIFDDFAYPTGNRDKKISHADWCQGIDFGLTLLATAIKNSGTYADMLEEKNESH